MKIEQSQGILEEESSLGCSSQKAGQIGGQTGGEKSSKPTETSNDMIVVDTGG